jgi:hypothetical protein
VFKKVIIKLLNKIVFNFSKLIKGKRWELYQRAIGYNRIVKTYEFGRLIKIKMVYVYPNAKAAKRWLSKYKRTVF